MKNIAVLIYLLIGLGAGFKFYDACKPSTPGSMVCWWATGIVVATWPMAIGARLWDFKR